MNLVPTTPFTMTRQVAELLWGQILKDAKYFDQQNADRFLILLNELGYRSEYKFMAEEYATLKKAAEPALAPAPATKAQSEVDHQADFQYHRFWYD